MVRSRRFQACFLGSSRSKDTEMRMIICGVRMHGLSMSGILIGTVVLALLGAAPDKLPAYGPAQVDKWAELWSMAEVEANGSSERLLWAHRAHGRMLLSDDNDDGVNRAGEELEKIVHQRDLEMQARAKYVEKKMHDLVTSPWANVHPMKLERDERRDEALVKQAERQVKADRKLLKEAKSVSEHDKKLLNVAVARKNLLIDSDAEQDSQRRQQAIAHLALKHLQHPTPVRHTVPGLEALSHAYKGAAGIYKGGSESVSQKSHNEYDARMGAAVDYSERTGPSASVAPHHTTSTSSSLIEERSHRGGSISARFEAVQHKASSLARLGEKHSEIYANTGEANAHHTVESLPYLLPPLGIVTLLLVFGGSYFVKRWQKIPNGLDAARQQDINQVRRGLGKAADDRAEWQELRTTV